MDIWLSLKHGGSGMQERNYCSTSGAGWAKGVLVSKADIKWCGVEDWVQMTADDKFFQNSGEGWEDRDGTEVRWHGGLGYLGDGRDKGFFPLGGNYGLA